MDYLSSRLHTERLILRALQLTDAPEIERLAGDREVAATTLNIPHPYPPGAAEEWIVSTYEKAREGMAFAFAIVRREDQVFVGGIGLRVDTRHNKAELGYWIGKPYWGCGYATEAARRILEFGFDALGLNRIHACYFTGNPASGRVQQKIGMIPEGVLRQDILKWGEYLDSAQTGILRSDWVNSRGG